MALAKNLGIAAFELGDLTAAYYYFAFSLEIDRTSPWKLANRPKVEKALAQIEQSLGAANGKVEIKSAPTPNAVVCIALGGGKRCFKAPFKTYLTPGRYGVTFTTRGEEMSARSFSVAAGATVILTEELETAVPGAHDVTAKDGGISAGRTHTCVLEDDREVRCAGDNRMGQVGSGGCEWYRTRSKQVAAVDAVSIAAGSDHVCAVRAGGEVVCWGSNSHGQIGNGLGGNAGDLESLPAAVVGLPGPAQIAAAGAAHSCALLHDQSIWCWGDNSRGQLGLGPGGDLLPFSSVAVPLAETKPRFVQLDCGAEHCCAVSAAGDAWCWGAGSSGQLGNRKLTDSHVPVPVPDPSRIAGSGSTGRYESVTAGWDFTCALLDHGSEVACWGEDPQPLSSSSRGRASRASSASGPETVQGLPARVLSLDAGERHVCAVDEDGAVWCWGENDSGQLGSRSDDDSLLPVLVEGLPLPASSVSAGGAHTCALLSDGGTFCWGDNSYGQLGDSALLGRKAPAAFR